ncbi:MAG TPA: RNA 2',3'-cyclic phosphodiesterase [Candidatus Methylomirabilis sp.]|nr:RNA 2',3'-cyclic phosphodiesterase [Candidatus Methylomirabilis sp.]
MRCFLSIPIPDDIVRGITSLLETQELPSRVRVIGRDLWHVSLVFLGDIAETDLDIISVACSRHSVCPGTLTVRELTTFPNGNPRLLVAGGSANPKQAWTDFIEDLRVDMMPYAPALDRKPWIPHITVGRGPKDTLLPRWSVPAGTWTWQPGGFSLMQSALGPDGPTYTRLHEFPFV